MRVHPRPARLALALLLAPCLLLAAEKKPKRLLLDDFEGDVVARWQHFAASPAQVKKGKSAARWTTEVDAINLKLPHDWSPYREWKLTFWCHSEKATQARFVVMLASDNTRDEGPNFFYTPITVDWTGWKEFRVPLKSFKEWDGPTGLQQVDAVSFCANIEWLETKRVPDTLLHVDELALEE